MRVRYYVHCFEGPDSTDTYRPLRVAYLLDVSEEKSAEFSKYLFSALHTDFPECAPAFSDNVLEQVERIERGEIDAYEYEGQGFTQHITRDRVRFEHTIFGECPEWPIWYCTLAQYKTALKGYRQFLDMPKSIESELIIELPEDKSGIA